MTNLIGTSTELGALPPLVAAALVLTVTLVVRLRRRGRARGTGARVRLLARASLLGVLRRLLGEAYVVLSRDDIDSAKEDAGAKMSPILASTVLQNLPLAFKERTYDADGVDCLLIRRRDLSPVCAVALGKAPETPLDVPVVTLPLKRAYALQDVDAALSPLLNAPPPVTPELKTDAKGEAGNAELTLHTSQRDAPRLHDALSTH